MHHSGTWSPLLNNAIYNTIRARTIATLVHYVILRYVWGNEMQMSVCYTKHTPHLHTHAPISLSSSLSPVSTERQSASPTTTDQDCFLLRSLRASSGSSVRSCRQPDAIRWRCSITAIDLRRCVTFFDVGTGPENGGVDSRSLELAVVVSGLKLDDPIELQEILWRLICRWNMMSEK